jgi:hypothetical protein
MDYIIIRGQVVTLAEMRADVKAAIAKGLLGRWAFAPETVDALLNKIDTLNTALDEIVTAIAKAKGNE